MNVSRNEPCPCGSGVKFKRCCGKASTKPTPIEFERLVALFQSGRYAELEVQAKKLLERFPESGLSWKLFCASLQLQSKDALHALQMAAKFLPDDAEAQNNLGLALQDMGQFESAVASYNRALKINPVDAAVLNNLGTALQDTGQFNDGAESYRQALRIKPDYADAQNNLGNVLRVLGKLDAAVACCRQALAIRPDFAEAYSNLGNVLKDIGQLDEAVDSYHQALKINPEYAEAYNNLGNALKAIGKHDEALASYRHALALNPNFAEAYMNLGVVLSGRGAILESLENHLRALKIQPDCLDINRAYLAALLYHPTITVEELFREQLALSVRMGFPPDEIDRPFSNSRDLRKKLRIGFVSSDLRNHPVGRNIMPLLESHDRSKFEIYLYGNVRQPDGMTDFFKSNSDAWRSIIGTTDQAAAEMIRCDEIDILVLLAGRFDDNRPLIATYRAAPVQVSFHDPATSGLKAVDYLITDLSLSPRETKEQFTERLIHLPTFYIHPPMINAPDVSLLPAWEKGYVTFGSFNNPSKVNEKVVALWSRVLHAVPDSRLKLKYKNIFGNENVRQRFYDLFISHGIEVQRIELVSASDSSEQHMARYAAIDMVLDTFPFTGSTTTFEALWMGVPVITLLGDHMVARWSGAMLKKLNLNELVAHDEDEYVKIAQGLAHNLDYLGLLRSSLRERVAKSPLCDEQGRARQIERAFRWMWAKWCSAGQS